MDQQELFANAVRDAILHFWTTEGFRRLDMAVESYWARKREVSTNPLVKKGEKYFSQNDEDGILIEICRRMKIEKGHFLELGVGNGLENNSLILLMLGWQGAWLGGEDLAFELPQGSRLRFVKTWITRENCLELIDSATGSESDPVSKSTKDIGFLSIDLDGNDVYVLETILQSGLRPRIVVVEYNGKFPPPIRWRVTYDAAFQWAGDDYQGASLQDFVDTLEPAGYQLVACNITGVNAFFVRTDCVPPGAFDDVPREILQLFAPADYNWFVRKGHATSPRTIVPFLK